MRSMITVGCLSFLFLAASAGATPRKPDFAPAHVQVCRANLDESGQGVAYEMVIQFEAPGTCKVVYYYGFEYGSDTGYRSMFQIYPQSTRGLKCVVSSASDSLPMVQVNGSKGPLVKDCKLNAGGDQG